MKLEDSAKQVVGTGRPLGRDGKVSSHFSPGDIVIIDIADLDHALATYLVSTEPGAVLNTRQTVTGRKPSLGAETLLKSGVVLVDDLGPDLLAIREGDQIRVEDASVYDGDALIAEGRRSSEKDVQQQTAQGDERLSDRIRAYSLASADVFDRERELILEGKGLPDLHKFIDEKVAFIVGATPTKKNARAIRRLMSAKPSVLIAVGPEGLDAAKKLRRKPSIVVGDPGPRDLGRVEKADRVVLVELPDGTIPGEQALRGQAIGFDVVSTGLSENDVARLIAADSGAALIVNVDQRTDLQVLADSNSNRFDGHLLVLAQLEDKVIADDTLRALERPLASGWLLALLVIVGLAAIVAAILLTPWGASLIPGMASAPLAPLPGVGII